MLYEFSRELDQLKAEAATLKAENAALRRDCQSLCVNTWVQAFPRSIEKSLSTF
jgi:hypothetical protein